MLIKTDSVEEYRFCSTLPYGRSLPGIINITGNYTLFFRACFVTPILALSAFLYYIYQIALCEQTKVTEL